MILKANKLGLWGTYRINLFLCDGPVGISFWQEWRMFENKLYRIRYPECITMIGDNYGSNLKGDNGVATGGLPHNYHYRHRVDHCHIMGGPLQHQNRTGGLIVRIDGSLEWLPRHFSSDGELYRK